MDAVEKFRFGARLLASSLLVYQGLYYATTQPGPMDFFNGIMAGTVIYALWLARDPKPKLTVEQRLLLQKIDEHK